jgi:SNF2 family DNA or RNA helicase
LLGYPPHAENSDEYTTNANHVVYYVQDWSHPKRAQSEDRCHRRGTRTNIRVTDLCVPDTIDEEIRDRVMKKRHAASELSDIREILESVLKNMRRHDRDAA